MDRLSEIKSALEKLYDQTPIGYEARRIAFDTGMAALESLQSDQCAECCAITKRRARNDKTPSPPVSGPDYSWIRSVERYDGYWKVNGNTFYHQPKKKEIAEAYDDKPVARDEKTDLEMSNVGIKAAAKDIEYYEKQFPETSYESRFSSALQSYNKAIAQSLLSGSRGRG